MRLLETVVAPLVVGAMFERPEAAFELMSQRTAVWAIQTGEPGPLAQVCAGIDLAIWDMWARREKLPLWRLLGGVSGAIGVHASGINPVGPGDVVAAQADLGDRAFKLKIGFGEDRDLDNVKDVVASFPPGGAFMLDANQAWDLPKSIRMAQRLREHAPAWLEEPLRADSSEAHWQALADASPMALAAGENLIGAAAFEAMIASKALCVVQLDCAKWGGISGCLPVIDRIHQAGQRFCPHSLGAGDGQMASAQLLAARGRASGMLEVGANENPLRSELCPALNEVIDGVAQHGEAPGIGVEPNLDRLLQP